VIKLLRADFLPAKFCLRDVGFFDYWSVLIKSFACKLKTLGNSTIWLFLNLLWRWEVCRFSSHILFIDTGNPISSIGAEFHSVSATRMSVKEFGPDRWCLISQANLTASLRWNSTDLPSTQTPFDPHHILCCQICFSSLSITNGFTSDDLPFSWQ
jgi:hypothetical protein